MTVSSAPSALQRLDLAGDGMAAECHDMRRVVFPALRPCDHGTLWVRIDDRDLAAVQNSGDSRVALPRWSGEG